MKISQVLALSLVLSLPIGNDMKAKKAPTVPTTGLAITPTTAQKPAATPAQIAAFKTSTPAQQAAQISQISNNPEYKNFKKSLLKSLSPAQWTSYVQAQTVGTELTAAAYKNDLTTVQQILATHPTAAEVNFVDQYGNTALIYATTSWNNPTMTTALLKAGANPNVLLPTGKGGKTLYPSLLSSPVQYASVIPLIAAAVQTTQAQEPAATPAQITAFKTSTPAQQAAQIAQIPNNPEYKNFKKSLLKSLSPAQWTSYVQAATHAKKQTVQAQGHAITPTTTTQKSAATPAQIAAFKTSTPAQQAAQIAPISNNPEYKNFKTSLLKSLSPAQWTSYVQAATYAGEQTAEALAHAGPNLAAAALDNDLTTVQQILALKPTATQVNFVDQDGNTALIYATTSYANPLMTTALLNAGANPTLPCVDEWGNPTTLANLLQSNPGQYAKVIPLINAAVNTYKG